MIGDLFKVIPIDPSTPKSTTRSRPGIIGLWQDIVDILPMQEWQPKLDNLVERNENVQVAVDTVKGNLSRAVVKQILQMDEFKMIVDNLKALGLPVDCGISEIQKKLGWPYNTCACGNISIIDVC